MLANKRLRLLSACTGLIPDLRLRTFRCGPLRLRWPRLMENVPVRVFGLGTVEARVLSKIGFEVGAAITELNAYQGDLVKQDQVLAKLHATQQEAKVARAKAAVLSAEVAVKNRMPIPSRRAPSWRSAWRSTNASRSRPEALALDPEQAYANFRTPDIASIYHRDYLGSARLGLRAGADQYLSGFFGC